MILHSGQPKRKPCTTSSNPQIGPVSEALLEPAPLDVTLDCSWAGEAGCAGEDQEAGTGGAGAGSSHHLNGTCPDQRQQQQFKVAGASGRQGQHALAPAAPCAAGGGAGGGGGGGGGRALGAAAQAVAAVPPRAMRLAVVGLEVMPDLVQRSLESEHMGGFAGHSTVACLSNALLLTRRLPRS